MNLLTYHGTIVRRTPDRTVLSHVPLLSSAGISVDADFATGGEQVSIGLGFEHALEVEPGERAGTVWLKQAGMYVCAEPGVDVMRATRTTASIWETFLLVTEQDVMLLRLMLQHGWATAGAAIPVATPRDNRPPIMTAGFLMEVGGLTIDLVEGRPTIHSVLLPTLDPLAPPTTVECGPVSELSFEIALGRAPDAHRRLEAVTREAFQSGSERAYAIAAPPDRFNPPLFASSADSEFFAGRFWNGGRPPLGEQQARCEVRRSRNKYVLLQRLCEGIIFDEAGTYSEAGYFHTLHTYPDGLRRNGSTIMLERSLLAQAPRLSGPHAVIFNPHLSNYYHWLVEGMLALEVIYRELPPGTKILLPGTLAGFRQTRRSGFDHRRIIELLGFAHIPMVEIDAPICHLEEAVWLERYSIDQIPGRALKQFRDRIELTLGTGRPRTRRIYIQRQGLRRIANADELESFCADNGFAIHRLEDVDDDEQIRMFQEADYVIAQHGAALSNLLFCQPGTKVIELSPDIEFRPFFWHIAEKLDLRFGLLSCSTSDGTFHGNMTVDIGKLQNLFDLVNDDKDTHTTAIV